MKSRLHQPLFDPAVKSSVPALGIEGESIYSRADFNPAMKPLRMIIMAYDCIWTLLYQPEDITAENRRHNAEANLQQLGEQLEQVLGPEAFETDPRQLSFLEQQTKPEEVNNG